MRKILTQFVILRRSLTQFLSSWAEDLPRSFHHKQNTYPVYFITSRRLIQFLLKWLEDLSRFLSSWAETCPVPLIMIRILTQFLSSRAETCPISFIILRRCSFHHEEILAQFLSSTWAEYLPSYPVPFIILSRIITQFLLLWAETCPVPLIMIRILTQFLSSWAGTYPVPFIILSRILTQFLSSSWAEYLPISFHLLEEKSYPVPFIIRRRAPKNVPAVPSPWTPIESTVNQRLEPDIWNMLHKHYIS